MSSGEADAIHFEKLLYREWLNSLDGWHRCEMGGCSWHIPPHETRCHEHGGAAVSWRDDEFGVAEYAGSGISRSSDGMPASLAQKQEK